MKKNLIIGIIVLVIIYGLVMFLILGKADKSDKSTNYVIFNNLNLVHGDHSFRKVDKSEINNYKGKFSTYISSKYYGEYKLESGKVWNLFDDNGNFVNYDGTLFAVVPKLKNNVTFVSKSNLNNEDKEYIKNNFTNNFNYIYSSSAYKFNIKNKEYKLIFLNSFDTENFDESNYYNIVLLKVDSKYINISYNKGDDTKICDIISVITFNEERDIYIGINEEENLDSDIEENIDVLYKLENNKLKKVISN